MKTKITGEYQPKPIAPAAVGDLYYDDETLSNTLDPTKTCIGIVYVVNVDGKTGKKEESEVNSLTIAALPLKFEKY